MPKFKVRKGYVFVEGKRRYHEDNILELTEKEAENQLWKLELIPEEVAREEPIEPVVVKVARVSKNRAITKATNR